MKAGRCNVGVGLLVTAGSMFYGFPLTYLRDLAPDKAGHGLAGLLVPVGDGKAAT